MKKILTSIVFIFCALSLVWAQSGTSGNITWEISGKTLKLSGSGKMLNYTFSNQAPWYPHRALFNSLEIAPTITQIGNYAFFQNELEGTIMIPEGVQRIEGNAFQECVKITSISIPKSVTSMGTTPFRRCSELASITVHNENPNFLSDNGALYTRDKKTILCCPGGKSGSFNLPVGVELIGTAAFDGTRKLTALTLPEGLKEVKDLGIFWCDKLKTITLPASLEKIGYRFLTSCSELTEIVVAPGNKHFSSVNGILYDKDQTEVIAYPAGKISMKAPDSPIVLPASVKKIRQYCFYAATKVASITLNEGLTEIGEYAFELCHNLKTITIPSSVKKIEQHAFSRCNRLEEIKVAPGNTNFIAPDGVLYNNTMNLLIQCPSAKKGSFTIPKRITGISEYAFDGCKDFNGILVEPGNTKFISEDKILYSADKKKLIRYPAALKTGKETLMEGIKSIEQEAFSDAKLEEIIFPQSLDSIGKRAFAFSRVKKMVLPKKLKKLSQQAFYNCNDLEEVEFTSSTLPIMEIYSFRSIKPNCRFIVPKGSDISAWKEAIMRAGAPSGVSIEHKIETGCICPEADKIRIYSSKGTLHIESLEAENLQLKVYDLSGRLNHAQQLNGEVQLSLPAGVYMLDINGKKQKVLVY